MFKTECKQELIDFLKEKNLREYKVTVMPDFFLDRLISLDLDVAKFSKRIKDVAGQKGGSIDGISQIDMRGGNAINVASALASLGANVTPILCTSQFGLQQIKYHSRNAPFNTSHIKTSGKASLTTALEFQALGGKSNVMLRDLGALANFGPEDLDESDWKLIEDSDYLCLFNWAGTLRYGTELAQDVFRRARHGHSKTYYDTADPNPNAKGIDGLLEKVLKTDLVDILSLNENEAITYATLLDGSLEEKKRLLPFDELALVGARILAKHLSPRIDLHTTSYSATLKGKSEVLASTLKVKVLRATGAGDAWDAGNIVGDRHNLSDECRLMLANAVSACYLSDSDGRHPSKERLVKFLNDNS